ncbi:asparagine--tRNA ligase [Luteibaculum oceani]|uniref:Asparagine--tRNA ligase n=1 Tax=Luteibaculum oceani TaxID=1294296 RepID=A0A5C6VJU5_9FLAO|nr:asparagine--tRNA ligase [Luteibaculum oceani]TXC85159.1 asparagine--tRNA ligase [Luteibaculum oceani]
MSTVIKSILSEGKEGEKLVIKGWVRTKRGSKNVSFIALNDGSCLGNLQVVAAVEHFSEEDLKDVTTGACIEVSGALAASQGSGQAVELIAEELKVLGKADPDSFPMQPKKHSMEFLREHAHLRFRTNTMAAVFRIRHNLSFAIHKFFNDRGFYNLHTPIITGSDAEGAGEMFRVTTLPADNPPKTEEGAVNYAEDFFGKETNLTVSGQLEAELGALALGKVYTFGPTFRAENSNTTRHLAEFWMIEPEVAFNDLKDNMDLAEDFLKYCVQYCLDNCQEDLEFLDKRFVDLEKQKPANERSEKGLIERLQEIVSNSFERITYTEAINVLQNSKPYKKKKFKYPVEWGTDLQSEHERYLVEKHFGKPVIITDYPASFKAFYMRLNEDGQTVAAMDILFSGIGEIVGGSQREERLDVLEQKMKEFDIPAEEMYWYLDTRRFGTCVHSGFGLGFERLVQFVTGMGNIRDVIPFPRTPKNAEF